MTDTELSAHRIPERPSLDGLEERWSRRWQEENTYAFDRSSDRADVYAIDTPPPTVSGELHIGHVYSFTHTDIIARFQRMHGKAVFYPMGWDDNGLPTERRVQNYFGVRCEPTLPYDPTFQPPPRPGPQPIAISRRNFIELCERLTAEDERAYETLWRRLGLSVDWAYTYTTIGDTARSASQWAFLRNLARGEAYLAEAPTLWDVTFSTAVAQAELEDRERPAAFHRLRFGPVDVDTTRPELLPACVALVCHPTDEQYSGLVGQTVRTPLFNVDVPVYAHPLADPAKGTGIAMVCTFGDLTDVTWWRELNLPTRSIIGRDGRLLYTAPSDVDSSVYGELAGRTVPAARRRIVELLGQSGNLIGEPRPVTHSVKFYEKGEAPLEIVTSRQWYIRNGGRDPALRERLVDLGRQLRWVPAHMRHRYEHWVNGLIGDWLISRQRYFGVPIPLWYPLNADGEPDYTRPIIPAPARLPVDPASETPDGYREDQRGRPGGFVADPDVMDTWATSSLTPQIVSGWERDPDLFARVYPMDLRPQAHEIIRTWLFASVVRAHYEFGRLPWHTAVLSGWILDPDRKKMSKSKGNVLTPMGLLEQHGSDAVRYWAAMGRPGTDLAFDEGQMRIGRRLATKLLNASRFVLSLQRPDERSVEPRSERTGNIDNPLDTSMLAELSTVAGAATAAFEAYDYTSALTEVERFFWAFCDDYIELVKERAYGAAGQSARAALLRALQTLLRLFAPFLPYVTEEIWSWSSDTSVHRAPWPHAEELAASVGDRRILALTSEALRQIRRAKSAQRLSMKADVALADVAGPAADLELISRAEGDLRSAGRIAKLAWRPADTTSSAGDASPAESRISVTCTF
jgi:valyl-tRNA synthetase